MAEPWPLVEPLDSYLAEVVKTLQAAVTQGTRRLEDDPSATDRALRDCEEILDSVMRGDVQEWVA